MQKIWTNITAKIRLKDLKLLRVEKPLVNGLTALSKLDKYVKPIQDTKDGVFFVGGVESSDEDHDVVTTSFFKLAVHSLSI